MTVLFASSRDSTFFHWRRGRSSLEVAGFTLAISTGIFYRDRLTVTGLLLWLITLHGGAVWPLVSGMERSVKLGTISIRAPSKSFALNE